MESKTPVILADAGEEFRLLLKQAIEDTGEFEVLGCTGSGREVLQLLETVTPQILISDLLLPELDGLSLLREVSQRKKNLKTIVLTAFCTDYAIQQVAQAGAYYFLSKPCQLDALLNVMRQASKQNDNSAPFPAALEGIVTAQLHKMGMPAHLKGFRYVREAILQSVREPDLLNALTKELYPRVAEAFGVHATQVERSIRTAIEHTWDYGNQAMLQSYFRFAVNASKPRPCNGHFIAILAEDIRRQLYCRSM